MFPFAPVTRLVCVALVSLAVAACAGKGDVRLIGRVQDAARRERAEIIARGVSGVHSIHNELTVGAAA